MIIKNSFILMFLFFSGCRNEIKDSSKQTYIVANTFAEKMQKFDLKLIGVGEGINHDTLKQNYIRIVFTIKDLQNIEIARSLIIEAINELQCEINTSEGIRRHLDEYPFPIDYINVGILNENEAGELFSVFNHRNHLIYHKRKFESSNTDNDEYYEETIEEALEIKRENKIRN